MFLIVILLSIFLCVIEEEDIMTSLVTGAGGDEHE